MTIPNGMTGCWPTTCSLTLPAVRSASCTSAISIDRASRMPCSRSWLTCSDVEFVQLGDGLEFNDRYRGVRIVRLGKYPMMRRCG